jgi:hypothetical protein
MTIFRSRRRILSVPVLLAGGGARVLKSGRLKTGEKISSYNLPDNNVLHKVQPAGLGVAILISLRSSTFYEKSMGLRR